MRKRSSHLGSGLGQRELCGIFDLAHRDAAATRQAGREFVWQAGPAVQNINDMVNYCNAVIDNIINQWRLIQYGQRVVPVLSSGNKIVIFMSTKYQNRVH